MLTRCTTALPHGCVRIITILPVIATIHGCRLSGPRQPAPLVRADRLTRVYPELRSGRFVVVADFEEPEQMELFHLVNASDKATCVLDRGRGRTDTGGSCLRFTAYSPGDTVVVNNARAAHWYLRRDWRPFDLLLMSVRSPEAGLGLKIVVAGGSPDDRLTAVATLPLDRGWTVARLDLAGMAERLPTDDIREIRLSVSGGSKPVQLLFDDIILTEHRVDLFGHASEGGAGLYVRQVGRRWKIGTRETGGGFELTFANGQIVEWYDTAVDPYHVRNLVRGTTLGPIPVSLDGGGNEPGLFTHGHGKTVAVRSKLVEMNSVRVVVTSERRYGDDAGMNPGANDGRPFERWTYTIYRSGQLYVSVEAASAAYDPAAARSGLAVALAALPGEEVKAFVGAPPGGTNAPSPAYGTLRNTTGDAILLYVVEDDGRSVRIEDRVVPPTDARAGTGSVLLMAVGGGNQRQAQMWTCHLFVGSSSRIADDEALERAVAYASPLPPRVELGSPVRVGSDRAHRGGFDPATGCYVLTPGREGVRIVLEGDRKPYFSPRFQILDTKDRRAWVYVDDVVFDDVAHDADGNLVFQLQETIRKPTVVEVLFSGSTPLRGG